ncbi:MAG: branched-chain amino acid ABC transporter permease, partial [Phycisphaerales bacterium]|nr:branched-chain amino acid ABC transporter permease [Phycisphaerales bacterium]
MRTLAQQIESRKGSGFDPVAALAPWLACVAVGFAVHYGAPLVVNDYWVNVLRRVGVFVMAAVSLNIVNGFTGQFSMGHAGFMAVGAYVGAGTTYYGSLLLHGSVNDPGFTTQGTLLMLAGVSLGACVAAGFGYIVGLPSLRLRGDYLAIVTLGFGEIIRVLLELTKPQLDKAEAVREAGLRTLVSLNGPTGFFGTPAYATLFWIWLFAAITCVVAYRVKVSSSGRAFLSIREDEIAARSMGINLTKYKVRAFVLAAFFGGVAGALYAHTGVNPSPTDAGFARSFDIIIFVVLGGLGSISGAAIAAVVLTVLTEVLRGPQPVLDNWVWLVIIELAVVGAVFGLRAARNGGWRVLAMTACIVPALMLLAGASLAIRTASGGKIDLADYRMVLYALMLILLMILRPNGLLGVHEVWDLFTAGDKRPPASTKPAVAATVHCVRAQPVGQSGFLRVLGVEGAVATALAALGVVLLLLNVRAA